MRRTLYQKFMTLYALLGVCAFVLIATLGSHLIENHLVESSANSLYKESVAIAESLSSSTYLEKSSLEATYYNLLAVGTYQDAQILILSPDRKILLDTEKPLVTETESETIDGFNPAKWDSGYYSIGDFFGYFSSDCLSVMAPITYGMNTKGYVTMHLPLSVVYTEREDLLLSVYIICGLDYLMLALLLIFFSLKFYRPLHHITEGAKEYASGNLTHKIPVVTNDEMGYLAGTLNYMAEELSKTGESQKKFIANVSHDFRSPLTSIKGYVEAILDGTISPDMYEKYLGIVLFETERLNKLTRSLLTLNNISDIGKMLDISDFDINAVIKNTAASFEGSCRQKQLSIQLIFSSRTLMVTADMEKIQQVLYNLIDNAIKFSYDHSTIVVETTEKHGTVFVSVKDSGIGIPADSLKKVFDRFYKIDSSRGKDRKGTGLGLSIVKEIINAHNQNINVISTEGVGSEFIFTLSKAEQKQ